MRPNAFFRVSLLGFALLASACGNGDDSPTTPTPTPSANVSGTWNGDLVVQGSSAKMTWVLTEPNGSNTVAGTVLIVQSNGVVLLNGALSGTFLGASLSYTFVVGAGGIPSQPSCTGQVSGSAAETSAAPAALNGTFAILTSTCTSPLQSGPFTLTRA